LFLKNISGATQIIYKKGFKRVEVPPDGRVDTKDIPDSMISGLITSALFAFEKSSTPLVVFIAVSKVCETIYKMLKKAELAKKFFLVPLFLNELNKPSEAVLNKVERLSPKLIITLNETMLPMRILIKGIRKRLPKTEFLVIEHGILDYSSLKKKLDKNGYKAFQPLLSDYMACFGDYSKKIIERLNPSKKERIKVTGYPLFDGLLKRKVSLKESKRNKTILFVSSPRIWFKKEREKDIKATRDFMELIPKAFPNYKVLYRFKDFRDQKDFPHIKTIHGEIEDLLSISSVVVSIFSTVILQAAIMGIPVAKLDYNRIEKNPDFLWNIYSKKELIPTVNHMLHAKAKELEKQKLIVNDIIDFVDAPALPRLVEFIEDILR